MRYQVINQRKRLSHDEFSEIVINQNFKCAHCGFLDGTVVYKKDRKIVVWLTQDHIIPISKGGKTIPENMIPSCRLCNNNKKARNVVEWLYLKFGKDVGDLIYENIKRKQSIIAMETKERLDTILNSLGETENENG